MAMCSSLRVKVIPNHNLDTFFILIFIYHKKFKYDKDTLEFPLSRSMKFINYGYELLFYVVTFSNSQILSLLYFIH